MSRLEVITGPMFCGKTEELVRRLGRARIAHQGIVVIKPHRDNRTSRESFSMIRDNKFLSKYQHLTTCVIVSHAELIGHLTAAFATKAPDVLAIDEAQFFDDWIIRAVQELLEMREHQIRIIVSGLDMDFMTQPFGPMPQLMAMADDVLKLTAVCDACGEDAMLTYRKPGNPLDQVVVGDKDIYEARCRKCHAA